MTQLQNISHQNEKPVCEFWYLEAFKKKDYIK